MKLKWKLLSAMIVGSVAMASCAVSKDGAFNECMTSIHVDVIPVEGESWQTHSARMDKVARRACREWS